MYGLGARTEVVIPLYDMMSGYACSVVSVCKQSSPWFMASLSESSVEISPPEVGYLGKISSIYLYLKDGVCDTSLTLTLENDHNMKLFFQEWARRGGGGGVDSYVLRSFSLGSPHPYHVDQRLSE